MASDREKRPSMRPPARSWTPVAPAPVIRELPTLTGGPGLLGPPAAERVGDSRPSLRAVVVTYGEDDTRCATAGSVRVRGPVAWRP